MQFFVYGRLKTGESKSWILNKYIADTEPYVLHGYKINVFYDEYKKRERPVLTKSATDCAIGEIKTIKKWVPALLKVVLILLVDEAEKHNPIRNIIINGKPLTLCLFKKSIAGSKWVIEWGEKVKRKNTE